MLINKMTVVIIITALSKQCIKQNVTVLRNAIFRIREIQLSNLDTHFVVVFGSQSRKTRR